MQQMLHRGYTKHVTRHVILERPTHTVFATFGPVLATGNKKSLENRSNEGTVLQSETAQKTLLT